MSIFDRAPRREPRAPSARAYRLKLALAAIGAVAGIATAYFKDRNTDAEQRGVDRYRLDVLERRVDALEGEHRRAVDSLRGSLMRLLPHVRNVPAPPADGDEP